MDGPVRRPQTSSRSNTSSRRHQITVNRWYREVPDADRLAICWSCSSVFSSSISPSRRLGLVSYYLMIPGLRGVDLASPPLLFAATAAAHERRFGGAGRHAAPAGRDGPRLRALCWPCPPHSPSNFQMVGSTATIAVVDQAERHGHAINRRTLRTDWDSSDADKPWSRRAVAVVFDRNLRELDRDARAQDPPA